MDKNSNNRIDIKGKNLVPFVLTLFLILSETIAQLLTAIVMQQLIEAGVQRSHEILMNAVRLALILIGLACALSIIRAFPQAAYHRRTLSAYKNESFVRLLGLTLRSFLKRPTGAYLSAFTNDIEPILNGYINGLFVVIVSIVQFTAALIMMFTYNVSFTLFVILLTFIPIVVSVLVGKKLAESEVALSSENRRFTAQLKDLLSGFSVIKSFGVESEAEKIFGSANAELESVRSRRRVTQSLIHTVSNIFSELTWFGVFTFGAYLAINGKIQASVIIIFVQLMNYIINPIQQLSEQLAQLKAAKELVQQMHDITEPEDVRADRQTISSFNDKIELNQLSFGYGAETDKDALSDLNAVIRKNEAVAIVGGSGSGKSTLLNLLLGTYPNYRGSLKFDESEIRDLSAESINYLFALIQQDVFIFDKSIEENISLFKQFPREELDHAIERSGLADLIVSKGADFKCGENGGNLSGGERQRISIARALLKKSQILLVDEGTSALDNESAAKVMGTILALMDTTRIVVTHRLDENVLNRFDRILVLKDGKLVENGTYRELMESKGTLFALVQIGEESGDTPNIE